MNLIQLELMSAPSFAPGHCVVCGAPYPTEHHPVPRSAGGHDGPVLHLCGDGTRGCHGLAEAHKLYFRYDFALYVWKWLKLPQALKYDRALDLPGWRVAGPP
jgi:hypothetical protein